MRNARGQEITSTPEKVGRLGEGETDNPDWAPARRPICVELPREAVGDGSQVGRLRMILYGTRDAAADFQEEIRKFMRVRGFEEASTTSVCPFLHMLGDDVVTSAFEKDTDWFRKVLKSRFEIKMKIVGHTNGLLAEARVLNRIVRAAPQGWEYEPDQRHTELIATGLGLEKPKQLKALGEHEKQWEAEDSARSLGPQSRKHVAR